MGVIFFGKLLNFGCFLDFAWPKKKVHHGLVTFIDLLISPSKIIFCQFFDIFFGIAPRYQIFDFFRKKKKKLKRPIYFWNISNIKAYGRKCTRRGTRPSGLLISKFSKRMSLEEFLNLGWFESQNYASRIEKTITTSLCINRKNKIFLTLDFFLERFKHCSIRT